MNYNRVGLMDLLGENGYYRATEYHEKILGDYRIVVYAKEGYAIAKVFYRFMEKPETHKVYTASPKVIMSWLKQSEAWWASR